MILITGVHKAYALYKAIEEGVSHMWTVSAFQMHPKALFVCDDDATLELRVKTVKYFKGLMDVHNQLVKDWLIGIDKGNKLCCVPLAQAKPESALHIVKLIH